ncbi:tetratricopeptide repeat protein [Amycolatopsis sp. A133]|uniref:tetratricopeptide repeat protein n=1 Tax=Amycolatopsis sp. A133 TaxID=3064472 RepID=UPI0027F2F05F|nr:tetratricopeptide repeat protein [Amycolatopsis sp. A133]MDQ7802358.1 tetratricopeptide repeat protein [Amycolatopsis sp. A133]
MGDDEETTVSGTANASGAGSIAVGAVGRDVHIGPAASAPGTAHAHSGTVSAGVVLGDLIVHQAAVPGPAAVVTRLTRETGDPAELFVGREEQTRRLLALLEPGAVVVTAVAGMGGIGKTALARHVGVAAHGRFGGGVFFVDLHGYDSAPIRPRQVFGSLLRVLDVPADGIPPDAGERAAVYHQVLDQLARAGRRVLLVLDNVSAADQVRDLLPRHRSHRALVTTRDTLGLPGAHRFDLDVLADADAVQLLTRVLAQRNPEDPRVSEAPAAALRLVRICGALPLAIRLTASILADEPSLPVDGLVGELTAAGGPGVHRTEHGEETVGAVFDQSWHRLRTRAADAAALLPLLTIDPGPDFATDAAAALAGTTSAVAAARLRTLRAASLLQQTATGRWQLHDLIRLCAYQHLTPETAGPAAERLLTHYAELVTAADSRFRAFSGEPVDERFPSTQDALAWLDAERTTLTAAVVRAHGIGAHRFAFHIGTYLTEYLEWRHHLTDWLLVTDYATRAAALLDDPDASATAWNNFGNALEQARRYDEAIDADQRALALFRELGDRRGEASSWSNLGIALLGELRIDEAIDAHRHALRLYRALGDRPGQGRAWANLAHTFSSARRYDVAINACRRSLRLFREIGDRHLEARAWDNLGNLCNELQRFGEAIDAYSLAVALHHDVGDQRREAVAWDHLGTALRQGFEFEKAIEAHGRAIRYFRHTGACREEGLAWFNLAFALGPARSVEEAKSAWETAARLFREAGDEELLAHTVRWLENP